MKKVVSLITIFILVGCASKRICPSAAEEPVSTCRAEAERKHGGTALGIILAGFNPTANARNPAIDQYNQCIDNSLRAQKANAGSPSRDYACKSEDVSPGHYESRCNQQ